MPVPSLRQSTLVLLLVAPAPGVLATSPPEGMHFSHHDWEIACDNTRTCRAAGFQADEAEFPVSVLLTRAGGPGTPVTAELQVSSRDEALPGAKDGLLALTLEIDGSAVGAVDLSTSSFIADLPAPLTAALLAALPGDATLRFVGSEQTWELSNRGAAAVLLKMDEFQGRLDTPGALLRKGQRDESTVPPALPPPRVVVVAIDNTEMPDLAADPALRAALRATGVVELCDAELLDEGELNVVRIDATRALASLPCWRGAYNSAAAQWVIAVAAPYRPQLVTTDANDGFAEQLIASHKGRGIGDCWSNESWHWDGQRFVHTEAKTSGQCKLVATGGAWSLPTLVTTVIEPTSRD